MSWNSGGKGWSTTPSKDKAKPSPFSHLFNNPVVQLGENLLSDVKDTVVGIPTGLVLLAKDPVATGKAVGAGIWHDYSPLFHGDFKEFGQQVYDHPLAPLLDIMSLATLGAGAGARGARLLSEAGMSGKYIDALAKPALTRPLRSGHKLTDPRVTTHTKSYAFNPLIRARQVTMERAINGLAGAVPTWFSVDSDLAAKTVEGFSGAQRADAWRWFREDKLDDATRRHTANAAGTMLIAGVMHAAKRLNETPAQAAHAFVPGIAQSIKYHAHVLPAAEVEAAGLAGRYAFVHANAEAAVHDFLRKNPKITAQGLADFISGKGKYEDGAGLGGKLVTDKIEHAARDADGNYLVARNHGVIIAEAGNSTNFLAKLGRSSTTAWKWAILGLRPAYLVNNAVGNMFMYFVSQGPHGARGLVDAMRQLYTPNELLKGMSRQEKQWFRTSLDWQDESYMGLHRGFSKDASDMLSAETVRVPIKELNGVVAKLKRVAGTGLYDVTHNISDRTIRRMAINSILRKHPEVRALMKKGHHFDDAAREVSQNRAVRESVQQQVNDILGQYHYLNPTERAIRAVVPFYTWDRAIVRHGAHLYLDRPTTARLMTELGAEGEETTEKLLGQIPDFLRGAIPLSLLGMPESVDGRVPILGTAGYNPYSSIESIIKTGQALTTGHANLGEAMASQLNPFLTTAIEQTTGQRLLSGARLPESQRTGGLIPNLISSFLGNLPQTQIADAALTGPRGKPDSLYPGDWQQYLYAYLGFPAKALNPQTAAEIAKSRGR